jgi:hypothetical protein
MAGVAVNIPAQPASSRQTQHGGLFAVRLRCRIPFRIRRGVPMFNIVKRRDFMLGKNVSKEEAEKARDDYGKEYVVVQQLDEPPSRPSAAELDKRLQTTRLA